MYVFWIHLKYQQQSLCRSILQQLFYGLVFPNLLEAGEQRTLFQLLPLFTSLVMPFSQNLALHSIIGRCLDELFQTFSLILLTRYTERVIKTTAGQCWVKLFLSSARYCAVEKPHMFTTNSSLCKPHLAESSDEDIPDAMFKESCITEQTQYFFDNDERSYSGVLDCGNCSRYVC